MKKVFSILLATILIVGTFTFTVLADNGGVKLMLNGEFKSLVAYNIKGNNYFKLRDVANLLKGTEAEFDVIWNEEKKAIELLSGTPYSTKEEITGEKLINPIATSSQVSIYKDGEIVLLGAYNIAGNNFFKLRDIASAINFGVDWNDSEKIIEINTKKSYEHPNATNFGLNPKYLSLIGMSKSTIDKMLGNGVYFAEFGMTDYQNGIMIGWNSLGETPTEDSVAVNMYISLKNLFFNCPDPITVEQIKSQFNSSYEGYNAMDEERFLGVNYCGKLITFNIDYYLGHDAYAFLNSAVNYENPTIETIQIINAEIPQKSSAYYDYAAMHDAEFWSINKDWRDDRQYYYLADVDHDGQDEMVVKIGCGVGIYKEIQGNVQQVFYDRLPDSSGSVHYWVTEYNGKDYITYTSASSSEYRVLYSLKNGKLEANITSMIIVNDYTINDKSVSYAEYNKYIESTIFADGITKEGLK